MLSAVAPLCGSALPERWAALRFLLCVALRAAVGLSRVAYGVARLFYRLRAFPASVGRFRRFPVASAGAVCPSSAVGPCRFTRGAFAGRLSVRFSRGLGSALCLYWLRA